MAEGLQKQEEEMMDSSPDPMDMEVYLTKIKHKVVRPSHTVNLLLFTVLASVDLSALYHKLLIEPALFVHTLGIYPGLPS